MVVAEFHSQLYILKRIYSGAAHLLKVSKESCKTHAKNLPTIRRPCLIPTCDQETGARKVFISSCKPTASFQGRISFLWSSLYSVLIFRVVLHIGNDERDVSTYLHTWHFDEMNRLERQNLDAIRPVLASGAVFVFIFTFRFYRFVNSFIIHVCCLCYRHRTQNELWLSIALS